MDILHVNQSLKLQFPRLGFVKKKPFFHLYTCQVIIGQFQCYRTVQKANDIQSCSLNQPTIFKVVVLIYHSQFRSDRKQFSLVCQFFNPNFPFILKVG